MDPLGSLAVPVTVAGLQARPNALGAVMSAVGEVIVVMYSAMYRIVPMSPPALSVTLRFHVPALLCPLKAESRSSDFQCRPQKNWRHSSLPMPPSSRPGQATYGESYG